MSAAPIHPGSLPCCVRERDAKRQRDLRHSPHHAVKKLNASSSFTTWQ